MERAEPSLPRVLKAAAGDISETLTIPQPGESGPAGFQRETTTLQRCAYDRRTRQNATTHRSSGIPLQMRSSMALRAPRSWATPAQVPARIPNGGGVPRLATRDRPERATRTRGGKIEAQGHGEATRVPDTGSVPAYYERRRAGTR